MARESGTKKKVSVALDLDGTLVDSVTTATKRLLESLGLREAISENIGEQVRTYDIVSSVLPEELWEEGRKELKRIFEDPEVYLSSPPFPGSVELCHRLEENFDFVGYITLRPESVIHDTKRWLKEMGFPKHENVFRPRGRDKGELMSLLGAWWILEDDPEQVKGVLRRGLKGVVLDRPYNREENLPRAYSYTEFLSFLVYDQGPVLSW